MGQAFSYQRSAFSKNKATCSLKTPLRGRSEATLFVLFCLADD